MLKEVRNLLKSDGKRGIVKYNDNHDKANGQFASGDGDTALPTDSDGNPYKHPALRLPKKEYGKVTHSINDLYDTVYKGKSTAVIKLAMKKGYSMYKFEIHDFNEYNIYEKSQF